jgi:hypothetical protein
LKNGLVVDECLSKPIDMKRILLTLICAMGAAIASYAQPTSSAPDDPNAPKMTFTADVYNFDTIMQGDTVKYTFTFKNTGKSPLLITEALVGCGCTQPTFSKAPIAPGKTGTIYVEFRSAGKMGYQDKTVTVKSNNGSGDVVLHLKGTVIPKPAPAPGAPVK